MGSALTEMIGGCRSGRPMKFGAHVIAIEINVRCCGNIAFHEIDIKALDECSDPQADNRSKQRVDNRQQGLAGEQRCVAAR